MKKTPMTAQSWLDHDPYLFIEEHNYSPDDPYFDECADKPGLCCCSACQGLAGPAGAEYEEIDSE